MDRDNVLCGNSGFCGAGRVDVERPRTVRPSLRKAEGGDEAWDRDGADPMRRTESELSGIVTNAARVNVTCWVEEMLEPCGSLRDIWIGFSERFITSRDEPRAALRSTSTTAEVTGNNEARTHFAEAAYLRRKHVWTGCLCQNSI